MPRSSLAVLLALAILMAVGVTAAGVVGCRPGPDDDTAPDDSTGELVEVAVAAIPPPVTSDALGLVAFISGDGHTAYLWTVADPALDVNDAFLTVKVRPVYEVDQSWSAQAMALSPAAIGPYLALAEAFDQGTGLATRVTVVNVATGEYRRVLPNPGFSPQVASLQWSADGKLLFANGKPPLVIDIAGGADDVVWDLTAMAPDGKSEARRPLLSPDFSAVAFTRFYLSTDEGEDLWVLGEDEGSADRVTTGNLGAYPILWLGGAPDGSKPDGPFDYLLVQIGAISTGGGPTRGPAAVDLKTKELTEWYPMATAGARCWLVDAIDLKAGRALVTGFNAMTGREGTTFWRSLSDGAVTEIPQLDGLVVSSAVAGGSGALAAVAVAEHPDSRARQIWALGDGGTNRKLADTEAAENALVAGRVGDVVVLTLAGADGSGDQEKSEVSLYAAEAAGKGLRLVVPKVAATR